MSQEVQYKDPRVYEVSYLLLPTLSEEESVQATDALRKIITDQTGLPIMEEPAHLMSLAYPMQKTIDNVPKTFTQGYFGWIKFDVTPDRIKAITDAVEATPSVLRYLSITTVREDTRAQKKPRRPATGSSRPMRSRDTIEEGQPVSEAESKPMDITKVDEQIDELANIE